MRINAMGAAVQSVDSARRQQHYWKVPRPRDGFLSSTPSRLSVSWLIIIFFLVASFHSPVQCCAGEMHTTQLTPIVARASK